MNWVVWQCAACRLRFPGGADDERAFACPHCREQTAAVRPISPPSTPPFPNQSTPPNIIAILDNIRSVQNVGAMFRSADGAGLRHLHLCGITPTPNHRKMAKTALGAERSVAWTHHKNGLDLVAQLQGQGFHVWALEGGEQAANLLQTHLPPYPVALVVGNEIAGVDPAILERADRVVALPMRGVKTSLNAAAAFGIAAYWVTQTDLPTTQPARTHIKIQDH